MHNTVFCAHCSPQWFLGIDSLFELFFFFILIVLAWYAYRVYCFTGMRPYRHWSVGFFLIALAYLAQSVVNFIIYHEVVESTNVVIITEAVAIARAFNLGILARVILFLLGYLSLVFVALHCEDWRFIPIFAALAIITGFAVLAFPWLFEVVVAMALVYLIILTAQRRERKRSLSNKLVIGGFILVLLGQLSYLFLEIGSVAYVFGHVFEFLGYCSLLLSLLLIMRKK